jgi:hypothetical protein
MLNLTADTIADKLIDSALRHGGGTIAVTAYGRVPTAGYVVSYDGGIELSRLFAHRDSAEHKALCEFIERNYATVVFNPLHYFGSWQHNGITYVDVSRVFSERQPAIDFARMNHQRALFNLATGESEPIPARVTLAKPPVYVGRHRKADAPNVGQSMRALDAAMRPKIDYRHRDREVRKALRQYVTVHGTDVRTPYALAL